MTIGRTRRIEPRKRLTRKKKVRFVSSVTQKVSRRIVKKYRNQRKKRIQTAGSIIRNLAKWEINMGAKAINSKLGKN